MADTEPDTFYTSSGGLGWNLPASVGIPLAERDTGRNRPVIAIIGDGSFQYSVQSIWSAVQHHLQMLIVIMRNDEYAILKSFAVLEQAPGVPGLDLPGLDIVSIARGYGCDAATSKIWVRSSTPQKGRGRRMSLPSLRSRSLPRYHR